MIFMSKLKSVTEKTFSAIAALLLSSYFSADAQNPITINDDNSVTITYIDSVAEQVDVQGTFFKKGNSIIQWQECFQRMVRQR